jgi:LysM repeat protein
VLGLSVVAAATISLTVAGTAGSAFAVVHGPATATVQRPHRTAPRHRAVRHYTVRPGDSFWTIARAHHVDWYNLAADNGLQMYATLRAGQVLRLPRRGQAAHPPMPLQPTAAVASTGAPYTVTVPAASTSAAPVTSSTSSFEQCVISRESGGDPEASNGGYWGLFQFSASTWAAYGGNPADFGGASAAEQEQVFDNAVARGGESNWAPFDGC